MNYSATIITACMILTVIFHKGYLLVSDYHDCNVTMMPVAVKLGYNSIITLLESNAKLPSGTKDKEV